MFCLFCHRAGQYKEVVSLKEKNPKRRVSIAIGGPSEESKKYFDMAATPINRINFIESVLAFIK
jgi:GH18 family chitinase